MDNTKPEIFSTLYNFANRELIGLGSHGNRIYKVLNKIDNKIYAMKKIIINATDQEKYLNEISIFKKLNHPNIIKYYDSFIQKGKLCIIMEYAEGGDLKSVIKKQIAKGYEFIQQDLILKWFAQIVGSVHYIHSKKILHRDIKAENVFLSLDNNAKLGDFGIAKVLENTLDYAQTGVGTPFYLSPEICRGEKYNFKTDIWTLGCLLYEICALERPFSSEGIHALMINIISNPPKPLKCKTYSKAISSLIFDILQKDPSDRPDIEEIKNRLWEFEAFKKNYPMLKILDKNKLTIEIEEKENENENECNKTITSKGNTSNLEDIEHGNNIHSPSSSQFSISPAAQNNGIKFHSKLFLQSSEMITGLKNNTPSTGEMKEIFDSVKSNQSSNPFSSNSGGSSIIGHLTQHSQTTLTNTPTENRDKDKIIHSIHSYKKNIPPKSLSNNILNSYPHSSSNANTNTNTNTNTNMNTNPHNPPRKIKHFRQISINISSIQSPENQATYEYDDTDTKKLPSPLNNPSPVGKAPNTPNQCMIVSTSDKISPTGRYLTRKDKPNSTKVKKEKVRFTEDPEHRKSLIVNFLKDRYGKDKFEIIGKIISEKNISDDLLDERIKNAIGDEEHKKAIQYIRYLLACNAFPKGL